MALLALTPAGLLSASSRAAAAQAAPEPRGNWELIVPTGIVVPTGAQRGAIKRANLTAAQLSYVVRPAFAVMATFGWARSRDIASVGQPKLDLFNYDLGAELRAPRWIGGEVVSFSPFVALGAGARSYNYRSLDVDATHNLAAYGGVGGELRVKRVALRFEARNYVTGFEPLHGDGPGVTRNDVSLTLGLRVDW
jgi:hypothetical protein